MADVAVIGLGPVGAATAALLTARGQSVRACQRATPKALPAGAAFQPCDLLDADSVRAACAGVGAVVCAAGFAYDGKVWAQGWPAAMANLIAGCAASSARLVFADNLYCYGPQTAPLTEDMPLTDFGRKPKVRAAITRLWQTAHAAGQVRAVAVRAADFYGPGVEQSRLGPMTIGALARGKAAALVNPPDTVHTYTYVPDFARALVTLIDAHDEDYGQAWHVPNAAAKTTREVLAIAAARLGVPLKLSVMPGAVMAGLGLFVPILRELHEMRFQFDRPYLVDHTKFARRFWGDATALEAGVAATADAARAAI